VLPAAYAHPRGYRVDGWVVSGGLYLVVCIWWFLIFLCTYIKKPQHDMSLQFKWWRS
jgi:hypothetical protein